LLPEGATQAPVSGMKRIVVTMGDPAGIGGEIIIKALPRICRQSIPVIVGDLDVMRQAQDALFGRGGCGFKPFGDGSPGDAEFIDLGIIKAAGFGTTGPAFGEASFRYIIEGLKLIFAGEASAIVTCPINKKAVHSAGIKFTGHTELLAHYGGVTEYVMMMANRAMKVSLATIHIPLKDVAASITAGSIFRTIMITYGSLQRYFGIQKPYIKVCGLNPHAGEQGVIGKEEGVIDEAIGLARAAGIHAEGPFPADTLFHKRDCDAYIAMYHDQGLIPVKTIDFSKTVNITLGLPFIRTSPGHGTGFDIAGKGVADPASLIEAYRAAETMSSKTT